MITVEEILMGRDKQEPLTLEMYQNLAVLMGKINYVRAIYGKPLVVSSGYRPPSVNKAVGGSKNSAHMLCMAVDFKDPKQEFSTWCIKNINLLNKIGLYLEDPRFTKTWTHLQIRPTLSNPFIP